MHGYVQAAGSGRYGDALARIHIRLLKGRDV